VQDAQIDGLAGQLSESDGDQRELVQTFCTHAETVIEFLHGACDDHDSTSTVLRISRLQASCRQLGLDAMVLTLGQIRQAAQEMNSRAIRWLLANLSQEYMNVRLSMPDTRDCRVEFFL